MTTAPEHSTQTSPSPDAHSTALTSALESGFRVVRFLMATVAILILTSGVFTVQPNEVAVILRLGKPDGTDSTRILQPGLHWAFPYPIDEIVRIPINQSQSAQSSIGWPFVPPALEAAGRDPEPRGSLIPGIDGYLITGDGNVIHARASVRFRLTQPTQFTFEHIEPLQLLQNALDQALIAAAASTTAETALYKDKIAFKENVRTHLQRFVNAHRLGIEMDSVEIQSMAPVDVRAAFEAVLSAEQERSKWIHEATTTAQSMVLRAEGEAAALRSVARGNSNQWVLRLAAEAEFFESQLPHYQRNPDLFMRRLHAETTAGILAKAQDKFLLPTDSPQSPTPLRLQLNREPQRPKLQKP